MGKVIGIQGSPRRRGNTELLLSHLLDAARESGAETELVELRDLEIADCDGCHACWQGRECSKRDGMNGLYPRLAKADALVFGTPVYWYGPTALMKAFLDRFVYFNCPENRELIRGTRVGVVVPFEEESPETAGPLLAMFEKSFAYLEVEYVGAVLAPGAGERGDVLSNTSALAAAADLAPLLVAPR